MEPSQLAGEPSNSTPLVRPGETEAQLETMCNALYNARSEAPAGPAEPRVVETASSDFPFWDGAYCRISGKIGKGLWHWVYHSRSFPDTLSFK